MIFIKNYDIIYTQKKEREKKEMENNFWLYKVTWFVDGETRQNQGIVCAESFAEAAAKVDKSYDDVSDMTIISTDCYEVFDLSDLLEFLKIDENEESSKLGPQLIAALEEAIAITKGE